MKIAVIIWYTPETYLACREVMADREKLPPTYAAWQRKSEAQARMAIVEGRRLYRVPLAAAAFQDWCREKDRRPDAEARVSFALEAMRNRHVAPLVPPQAEPDAEPARGREPAAPRGLARSSDGVVQESLNEVSAAVETAARLYPLDELRQVTRSAQQAVLRLLEEKSALKAQLDVVEAEASRLAAFNSSADQYMKVKIAPDVYVYREKSPAKFGNALSFCPNCFEGKRISILQGHPFGICRICNFRCDISWRAHV